MNFNVIHSLAFGKTGKIRSSQRCLDFLQAGSFHRPAIHRAKGCFARRGGTEYADLNRGVFGQETVDGHHFTAVSAEAQAFAGFLIGNAVFSQEKCHEFRGVGGYMQLDCQKTG